MPDARRVALISGGSGAIGRAVATRLAEAGRSVAVGYHRSQAAAEACVVALAARFAAPAGEPGPEFVALPLDVSDPSAVEGACRRVFEEVGHGRLDILVNCAAINVEGPALDLDDEAWSRVLDVDLGGPFRLCREAGRYMVLGRWGRIVNVSSVVAGRGGRGQANYAVAKAGLERLTKVLALELGRKGITANCVAPGVIETPMSERVRRDHGPALLDRIALRRFGNPGEVAHLVAFLASEEAGYLSGQVVGLDGGFDL